MNEPWPPPKQLSLSPSWLWICPSSSTVPAWTPEDPHKAHPVSGHIFCMQKFTAPKGGAAVEVTVLPSLCGPPTAQGAKGRSRSHDWFLWFPFCHEASWETHQLGCGFVSLEAWRPDIILWCGVYGARQGLFSGPCVRCGAGVAANLAQLCIGPRALLWPPLRLAPVPKAILARHRHDSQQFAGWSVCDGVSSCCACPLILRPLIAPGGLGHNRDHRTQRVGFSVFFVTPFAFRLGAVLTLVLWEHLVSATSLLRAGTGPRLLESGSSWDQDKSGAWAVCWGGVYRHSQRPESQMHRCWFWAGN